MATEVDGACPPPRITGLSVTDQKQVDSLDVQDYVDGVDLETTISSGAMPIASSAPGVKSIQGSFGGASSSLHRVADKLKEKLSRQMHEADEGTGVVNSDLSSPPSSVLNDVALHRAQKSTSSETRSQYHSILKLSSPSSKSYAINSSFSPSHQGYEFPPSGARYYTHGPEMYPPGVADTLDVLRGMMKGQDGMLLSRKVQPFGRHSSRDKMLNYSEYEDRDLFANNKYTYSNNSDDDSFQSDNLGGSISGDEFSDPERNSKKGIYHRSRSSSLSSEKGTDHLQGKGDDEDEEEEEEEDEEEGGLGNNCADDSVCSEGSLEDRIEAKKARVENIISNMRPSPNSKTTTSTGHQGTVCGTTNTTSADITGTGGTPSILNYRHSPEIRRPKRKQYIPQQHDTRESELDEPIPKMRKLEKDAIHLQLQRMQEQLTEMQKKCFHLLDHDHSLDRDFADEIMDDVKVGLGSDLNRNEIQKLSSGILQTIEEDGKDLIEKASKQLENLQPSDSGKVLSLKQLAKLLKAEITSSVGTLVDSIVKNFMAKHMDTQKEQPKEPAQQQPPVPKSPKMNSFESARDSTMFDQPRDEPFLSVNKPLKPPPLAITRPPCLPPTLLPPLPIPVHPPFSEPNSLSQSVKQQRELTEKYIRPYFNLHGKTAFDIPQAHLPLFAPHAFYPPPMAKFQPLFVREPEQTEALPLVVSTPKKKRTKVTDTRLSPRAARAMLQESLGQHHHQQHHQHHHHQQQPDGHHGHQGQSHRVADSVRKSFPHHHHYTAIGGIHEAFPHPSMLSIGLPTSVAIHNPSLQHSDLLQAMYPHQPGLVHRDAQGGGPGGVGGCQQPTVKRPASNSPDLANTPNSLLKCDSDPYDQMLSDSMMGYDNHSLTSTLTPMHLRKAKLMFFYVRYPSSAILKIYFPDVKFNKNNTAQLVKWFSNFREFFYIQMEKYARQALAEGVKNVTDLVITADSELYRVLVLHYNRNNQIEVPENFRFVVQATLREFFISIASEKDQEQSWKKSIYKVIARMDDAVPEYFKSSNWMEQLADG